MNQIFICFTIAIALSHTRDWWIIPPATSAPVTTSTPPHSSLNLSSMVIAQSLIHTANAIQLMLNRRHRTFAGTYKLTATLRAIQSALEMLYFIPAVIGRHATRGAFSLENAIDVGLNWVDCWQAWTLLRVEQDQGADGEGEHTL